MHRSIIPPIWNALLTDCLCFITFQRNDTARSCCALIKHSEYVLSPSFSTASQLCLMDSVLIHLIMEGQSEHQAWQSFFILQHSHIWQSFNIYILSIFILFQRHHFNCISWGFGKVYKTKAWGHRNVKDYTLFCCCASRPIFRLRGLFPFGN